MAVIETHDVSHASEPVTDDEPVRAPDPIEPTDERHPSGRASWIAAAGMASLGAGAIHAAAIGVHAEHRPTAMTFTALAVLQIGWGALALSRPGRAVAAIGAVLGLGAVAGWIAAKTVGIGFIDGLQTAEPIQSTDGLAAALAMASALFALLGLRPAPARTDRGSSSLPMVLVAPAVVALTLIGMVAAGSHSHSGGEGTVEAAAGGQSHGHDGHASPAAAAPSTAPAEHEHKAPVTPVAYDPTKPIDLGGVPGVSPEQQARAENLIAVSLLRLPKWSDPAYAESQGFYSIGDGPTGTEHFVNQAFMNDDTILDPDKPESLVYDTKGGKRELAAAMYMVKPGTPLEEVPDVGGPLTQWHIHNNLCYQPNGKLGGLTDANGNCRPGLIKPPNTPMIHVWIRPHRCGPFAALEGIGGGQIAEGETKLCDTAHGGH